MVRAEEPAPLPLAQNIVVNGISIDLAKPPKGLVVKEKLGLLVPPVVDGNIIYRTPTRILETRAVITPKGDYLLMCPEGEHYAAGNGARKVNTLIAFRSSDKGQTWQGPIQPFDIDYSQHGFIPLVPAGSSRIYAFGTQPIPEEGYTVLNGKRENAPIGFRWSDDDGKTWSKATLIRPLNDPGFMGMSVMRMAETGKGTWILGSHAADWSVKPITTRQYLLRSEDQGKTWTVLPDKQPNGWFVDSFNRMDEGRPIGIGGEKVLFMTRTKEGHLFLSRSDDDGKTWSPLKPTTLVHPDAPPMLFPLSDGKTLAAFHHNRVPVKDDAKFRDGGLNEHAENMKVRSELWVSTSTDEGRTWSEPRFVLAGAAKPDMPKPNFNYQASYLDAFTDNGVLHLFLPYRWQQILHLTLKESDLSKLPTKAEIAAANH